MVKWNGLKENHVSVSFAVNIQGTQNTKAKNVKERMIREIFVQSRTNVKRRETAGNIPVTFLAFSTRTVNSNDLRFCTAVTDIGLYGKRAFMTQENVQVAGAPNDRFLGNDLK